MTEKTAEIVGNVLAQRPSAVVDAVGEMIKARAAEILQAKYQDTESLDEPEEDEVQPEGEEGNDEETE